MKVAAPTPIPIAIYAPTIELIAALWLAISRPTTAAAAPAHTTRRASKRSSRYPISGDTSPSARENAIGTSETFAWFHPNRFMNGVRKIVMQLVVAPETKKIAIKSVAIINQPLRCRFVINNPLSTLSTRSGATPRRHLCSRHTSARPRHRP